MCWKLDPVICLQYHLLQLQKHFENVHKNVKLEAQPVEGAKGKGKRPRGDSDNDSDDERHVHPAQKRQYTLQSMLKDACSAKLWNALAEYVIEDMQPLTTVESPAFCKLIASFCYYQLPDQKSFTQYLDKLYDITVKNVKESLEEELMEFQQHLMCGQPITAATWK